MKERFIIDIEHAASEKHADIVLSLVYLKKSMHAHQFCKQESHRWRETHARCPSSWDFRDFDLSTVLPPLVRNLDQTSNRKNLASIIFYHFTLGGLTGSPALPVEPRPKRPTNVLGIRVETGYCKCLGNLVLQCHAMSLCIDPKVTYVFVESTNVFLHFT